MSLIHTESKATKVSFLSPKPLAMAQQGLVIGAEGESRLDSKWVTLRTVPPGCDPEDEGNFDNTHLLSASTGAHAKVPCKAD